LQPRRVSTAEKNAQDIPRANIAETSKKIAESRRFRSASSLTVGDGACAASCDQATDGLVFVDQFRAKPWGKFGLLTSSQRRKCRTQGPRISIGKFWQ
jgi:hypothetical protein